MSPTLTVCLEFVISLGPVAAWGAWEFWQLRPRPPADTPPPVASPEGARHAEGEHGPDDRTAQAVEGQTLVDDVGPDTIVPGA